MSNHLGDFVKFRCLSTRTNSQKAEELYLPEHCWWHQLRIQVIAAEMLLIYSRHIQKQHGFGLTKFYFLGQTWWYLNLMIWFEEIKSRVNMSYDFGTALQWRSIKWLSNMMSVKIAEHCYVCSWYVNVEMFANWYEASVCQENR